MTCLIVSLSALDYYQQDTTVTYVIASSGIVQTADEHGHRISLTVQTLYIYNIVVSNTIIRNIKLVIDTAS